MAAGWDGYAVPLHAEQYVDKTWLVSVQEGRPSAWGSYPPEAKTQVRKSNQEEKASLDRAPRCPRTVDFRPNAWVLIIGHSI